VKSPDFWELCLWAVLALWFVGGSILTLIIILD